MSNTFNYLVGQRIKDARKKQHMTIKELGDKVGLDKSTISRYERGEISTLDIEKIKEFAKVLNVSSAYLTGWDRPSYYDKELQKWLDAVGELNFSDDEFNQLVNYAKFIISQRKN